ncbi:hypothetical protein [Moraxella sp. K2450]|uniref:hypothetical protein n=1 Tax=Moraxella sp. K2450 TaxID=2780076 RepID=UPI001882AFA9|nr:hypothetical protein [Moraxella sp. K2450]MBE9596819.1 hypothetical protein [Moraxella sp. K2450]
MSDTPQLTMLSRLEAQTLQSFIAQVDAWQYTHGEKAGTVEITYYPEDEGFEVENGEPNHGLLKRNRTTAFRAELLAWGSNQVKQLQGWDNSKTVNAFAVSYKDGKFGVAVDVADKTAEPAEPAETDESSETL